MNKQELIERIEVAINRCRAGGELSDYMGGRLNALFMVLKYIEELEEKITVSYTLSEQIDASDEFIQRLKDKLCK